MKDIHSHILYGIDDGARDLEESVELLKQMEEEGITDIILTPHYIENTKYTCDIKEKQKRIEELKHYTNIKLYIGNEVYISENTAKLLQEGKISTLNHSRYLLVELPMSNKLVNLEHILYELLRCNIIPIIAHPERYSYVQENIHYLDELKEMGILFQGNYESLFGKYGKNSEKTLIKLLKEQYITFLGSDIHRVGYSYHHNQVAKKVKKIVKDPQKTLDLIDSNIEKVIQNKLIEE